MNNKLFESITDQLAYFKEGNLEKFQQIFNDSINYYQVKNCSNLGLCKAVYLNFLITLGIVEVFEKDRKYFWVYLKRDFVFTSSGKRYSFNKYDENIESIDYFSFSGFDIFPKANLYLDEQRHDVENFLEKIKTLKIDWSAEIDRNFQKVDWFDTDKKTTQKFNFNKFDWDVSGRSELSEGIFRTGVFSYDKHYLCVGDFGILKTFDEELLFICASQLIKQLELEKLFIITDSNITIPWKVKVPSLFKRSLASISSKIKVDSSGYCFHVNHKNLITDVFNLFKGER